MAKTFPYTEVTGNAGPGTGTTRPGKRLDNLAPITYTYNPNTNTMNVRYNW